MLTEEMRDGSKLCWCVLLGSAADGRTQPRALAHNDRMSRNFGLCGVVETFRRA